MVYIHSFRYILYVLINEKVVYICKKSIKVLMLFPIDSKIPKLFLKFYITSDMEPVSRVR